MKRKKNTKWKFSEKLKKQMNGMKRYTIRDDDDEDGRQKVFDVTISLCYAFYVYLFID